MSKNILQILLLFFCVYKEKIVKHDPYQIERIVHTKSVAIFVKQINLIPNKTFRYYNLKPSNSIRSIFMQFIFHNIFYLFDICCNFIWRWVGRQVSLWIIIPSIERTKNRCFKFIVFKTNKYTEVSTIYEYVE